MLILMTFSFFSRLATAAQRPKQIGFGALFFDVFRFRLCLRSTRFSDTLFLRSVCLFVLLFFNTC